MQNASDDMHRATPRRRKRLLLVLGGTAVILAAWVAYAYWEAGQIEVVERELVFDGLPEAFDGLRIIHLSCIHSSGYGRVERRLRELLVGIEADLLVMAGDFKAERRTPDEAVHASVDRIFEGLSYPHGMVAVGGNHDWDDFYPQLVARGRFTCLLRSSLVVERGGERIAFLGVHSARPMGGRGDHEIDECTWVGNVGRRHELWPLLPDGAARPWGCDAVTRGDVFRILVAHTPDFMPDAVANGIDLVLSGDTHGGQIRLPLIGPIYVKSRVSRRYARGLVVEGGTQMYVNAGIGTQTLPLRFLCPPEITVLTLRRRK